VAVAADNSGAGQAEALFRHGYMHNAPPRIAYAKAVNAEFARVAVQPLYHCRRHLVRPFGAGRDIVISHTKSQTWLPNVKSRFAQAGKRVMGTFVQEMTVNIEKVSTIPRQDAMRFLNFRDGSDWLGFA
jgi:hypothetical protein